MEDLLPFRNINIFVCYFCPFLVDWTWCGGSQMLYDDHCVGLREDFMLKSVWVCASFNLTEQGKWSSSKDILTIDPFYMTNCLNLIGMIMLHAINLKRPRPGLKGEVWFNIHSHNAFCVDNQIQTKALVKHHSICWIMRLSCPVGFSDIPLLISWWLWG